MSEDQTITIEETATSALVQIIAQHEAHCLAAAMGQVQAPKPEDVAYVETAIAEIDRRIPCGAR